MKKVNNLGFAVLAIVVLGAVIGAFVVYVSHVNRPAQSQEFKPRIKTQTAVWGT